MNRHPVPDTERYSLVDHTNADSGYVAFVNFSEVKPSWGYRGCGVFSCTPAEVRANIDAIKRGGVRVFDKRSGAEI